MIFTGDLGTWGEDALNGSWILMRGLGRLDYAWPIVELSGKANGLFCLSLSLSLSLSLTHTLSLYSSVDVSNAESPLYDRFCFRMV